MREVTLSEPSAQMKRVLRWLGAASSLLFALACMLPTEPPRRYSTIEDSWIQVLHLAFLKHLQFGREIVFTFGPWGFLYGGYRPETHLLSVLIWSALAIAFWWAGWRAAQLSFENELARWAWVMAVISFTGITISLNIDACLIAFPLLLWLLHCVDEDRRTEGARNALVVSIGLLSLIKFTMLILSTGILVAIALDCMWRRRRVPWSFAVFLGSVLLFWLLAGQRLSSFGPYLRNSWEVVSGYTEAMMITGPHEAGYVAGFVILGLVMAASVAIAVWKRLGRFGALLPGALGFILFNIFKYGFVRDDEHEAIASVLLLLLSVMCFAIVWPAVRERRWESKGCSFLPVIGAYIFAALSFQRFAEPPLTAQWAETLISGKWLAPVELLYNGAQLRRDYEEYLAGYRDQFPLPPLTEDTDIYSWNQIALFANEMGYRPRPVFQSYSAYTPHLAALNAAHLRSDDAAQNIVWDGFTINKQYATLADGPSWPELLTRYDVQQVEISFVTLARAAVPRRYTLTPLGESTIKFGEVLSVPPQSNGVVWAEMDVERAPAGSLISALLKPPALSLQTTLGSGQQHTNRFVPGMACSGFILSPFVEDCPDFAALASVRWPDHLTENVVTAFRIVPEDDSPPNGSYRNSIRVRLYRLDFPRQDLENAKGYNQVTALKDAVSRSALIQKAQLLYLPHEGSVLGVPANSQMRFDRPKDARHLHIGFGMYVPEGAENTNGIRFRVSGVTGQNQSIPLWSRAINPVLAAGDRGKQDAIVDLDTGISSLVLETAPEAAAVHEIFRPYWFEIRFY